MYSVHLRKGKYDEADPLYVRAIAIGESSLGLEHRDVAVWLNNRAGLLKAQVSGAIITMVGLGVLIVLLLFSDAETPFDSLCLDEQGKYEEADALYRRTLKIDEKVHGPDHPEVAIDLNNWARLLMAQVRTNKRNHRCFSSN